MRLRHTGRHESSGPEAITVTLACVASETIDRYLATLDAPTRRLAPGEWGISLPDVGGWPLHAGLRLADGFLRVQCEAVGPDRLSDHELLFRNRSLVLVRYAHTGAGAVWVHGELPEALADQAWLDRLLGFVVEAALVARHRSAAA